MSRKAFIDSDQNVSLSHTVWMTQEEVSIADIHSSGEQKHSNYIENN